MLNYRCQYVYEDFGIAVGGMNLGRHESPRGSLNPKIHQLCVIGFVGIGATPRVMVHLEGKRFLSLIKIGITLCFMC